MGRKARGGDVAVPHGRHITWDVAHAIKLTVEPDFQSTLTIAVDGVVAFDLMELVRYGLATPERGHVFIWTNAVAGLGLPSDHDGM